MKRNLPPGNRPLHESAAVRRGAVLVLTAVLLVMLFAFVAFTIDVGHISIAKAELQNGADAAALAGAMELANSRRAAHPADAVEVVEQARQAATDVAGENDAGGRSLALHWTRDIIVGELQSNGDVVPTGDPRFYNAVQVTTQRTSDMNGPLPLFFAPLLGQPSTGVAASAIASLKTNVRGIRPKKKQPSPLIPFSIHIEDWRRTLQGDGPDIHYYSDDTGIVTDGADSLYEMDMFTNIVTTSGNFCTLRIGRSNVALPPLLRQILTGVSAKDLANFGGELALDEWSGRLEVPGDPGHETPVFSAAAGILGKPRMVCLHDQVTGSGTQASYRVVGFAAIRIVDVGINGLNRYIRIQPAVVADESVITGDGPGESYFVSQPVKLTR